MKEDASKMRNKIDEMIHSQRHGLWWEDALYDMSKHENVYVKNIEGIFWAEVDYLEDYKRIQDWVEKNNI